MFKRSHGRALAAALLLGLAAIPAGAQDQPKPAKLTPPTPKRSDSSPPLLWNYFVGIVIAGTVIIANLIPSKRGHQD